LCPADAKKKGLQAAVKVHAAQKTPAPKKAAHPAEKVPAGHKKEE
jgi:hypothetical protein